MNSKLSKSQNIPVSSINLERFSGTWYSLSSIPTFLDKNWRQTIEYYTLDSKGYYHVYTTYNTLEGKAKDIKSKLFPGKGATNADMKAQFLWPFKIGYRIIELPSDYSYVVIGHPDRKYLFIMSRKPEMDQKLFDDIVKRCKETGYDTDKLVSQDHRSLSGVSIP